MNPTTIGLLGLLVFLLLVLLRTPIPFAMIMVGFAGFSLLGSPGAAVNVMAKDIYSYFSSYSFSVIPMFILMGYIALHSGMGKRLFSVADKLIGHKAGGLIYASQGASALFGAICGSNIATLTTIGNISLPEMRKRNYYMGLSGAAIAAAAPLGILIPPSTPLLAYSALTGESVGKLFIAGIVPGILLMIVYMAITWVVVSRNQSLAPPSSHRASLKEIMVSLAGDTWEAIAIFILSIGGLFAGWFTPTEAGAVGAGGLLLISVLHRTITLEGFKKSLADTTRTTALVMMLLAGAMIFGRFMTVSQIPTALANLVTGYNLPPYAVILLIYVIYIVLGCFIEALPMALLTIPVFLPVVTLSGYSAIWFGVAQVLMGSIGSLTPPVGLGIFIVKGIAGKDVSLEMLFKSTLPFIVSLVIVAVLAMIFPSIITLLPQYLTY